jgi:two-component system, LytTR family, sensor kinase
MATLPLRRSVWLLIHVLIWAVLGGSIFLVHPLSWGVELPNEFWIKQIFQFTLLIGAFYLSTLVLVPKLLLTNQIGWFILANVGLIAFMILFRQQADDWLNMRELMHQAFHPPGPSPAGRLKRETFDLFGMLITLGILSISTSMVLVQKWQRDAQLRQVQEQQRVETELAFLKAQINPHFFFNTLNNIYALTLIDGETAREALHKLSRLMRYVLYDTQAATTLLSKEVAFVQDYIELMKLRLTDNVTVHFEPPQPLYDASIAPMLLLPFIENAFKHGVSGVQPSHIHIDMSQPDARHLRVAVRNSRFADKTEPSPERSNGIGLVNTRRRLDLLYPGRYSLTVRDSLADTSRPVDIQTTKGTMGQTRVLSAHAVSQPEYVVELTLNLV